MTIPFLRRKLNEYSLKNMKSMMEIEIFIDWLEQYAKNCRAQTKKKMPLLQQNHSKR